MYLLNNKNTPPKDDAISMMNLNVDILSSMIINLRAFISY